MSFYKPAGSKTTRLVHFSGWSDLERVPDDLLLVADEDTIENATRLLEIDFLFDKLSLSVTCQDGGGGYLEALSRDLQLLLTVATKHAVGLALWSGVRVLDAGFTRPVPPRDMGPIPIDGLLDVINTKALESFPRLCKLLDALPQKLPGGVSLETLPPYVFVNWTGVTNGRRSAIESAMLSRLLWYYSHGEFEIAAGYNEFGDSLVVLFNAIKDPFYTFYVPYNNAAYKALADVSGKLEEDNAIRAMQRDLRRAKTRKGRSLSSVTLIFPSRELAIKYRRAAKGLGFADTAFPTNDGKLWIPVKAE